MKGEPYPIACMLRQTKQKVEPQRTYKGASNLNLENFIGSIYIKL